MQRFLRAGFVRSENLSFTDLGDAFVELDGVIECSGNININVYKRIQIIEGDGPNALVQTVDYSYHAYVANVGNILRYDSPHLDHYQEHHVHRFDTASKQETSVDFIENEEDRPTLGEIISEVENWYYDNVDWILARSLGDFTS
jgi:hypothetical protein